MGLYRKPNTSCLETCSIVEVVGKGGLVSTSNKYRPVAADRDGITLRCIDTVHIKWRVQDDIIKSMDVEPKCKLITLVMCYHQYNVCFYLFF